MAEDETGKKLIALKSQNDKKNGGYFSITIFLVLIFIARNIKTNDFHFIWPARRERYLRKEEHLVAWKM